MPASDPGLFASLIFLCGASALTLIVIVVVRRHRAARLTRSHALLGVTLGLSVLALAGVGILSLSPVAAQGSTPVAPHPVVDIQLPTK